MPNAPPTSPVTTSSRSGGMWKICFGKAVADEEHALARRVQEIAIRRRVVARPCAARLDRRDRNAVVDDVEADDARGAGECLLGCGGIAGGPVEGDVVRRLRPDLRAADGLAGVGHRGKRLIVDDDQLGRIGRLRGRVGDDAHDRFADEAHVAVGKDRPMRIDQAVAGQPRRANQFAKTIGLGVHGRQDRANARRPARGLDIDRGDPGMRVR